MPIACLDGALLSYRRDLLAMIKQIGQLVWLLLPDWKGDHPAKLRILFALAFSSAAIMGLLLKSHLEHEFSDPLFLWPKTT